MVGYSFLHSPRVITQRKQTDNLRCQNRKTFVTLTELIFQSTSAKHFLFNIMSTIHSANLLLNTLYLVASSKRILLFFCFDLRINTMVERSVGFGYTVYTSQKILFKHVWTGSKEGSSLPELLWLLWLLRPS